MACVASPMTHIGGHNHLNLWGSMNDSHNLRARTLSHAYPMSQPDRKKAPAKKRASRAGTRSVSTLSTIQLEKKRANDREAQRAIRQRTKDHIETLERNIEMLRDAHQTTEKALYDSKERGRALEHEINYLRAKLSEAGLQMSWSMSEAPNRHDENALMLQTGSSIHNPIAGPDLRAGSMSTQFGHSGASSRSPSSTHGSFQASSYLSTAPSSTVSLASSGAIPPSLTSWRSQDSATSGQDENKPNIVDYSSDPFSMEVPRSQPFESPGNDPHPSQHYSQSSVQDYSGSAVSSHQQTVPSSRPYPSLMTPDFVPNGPFSMGQPQTLVPSEPYSVTPVPLSSSMTGYVSPNGQLQATSLPGSSYPTSTKHELDAYSATQQDKRPGITFRETEDHVFGLTSFPNN